jgi:hypothetical protein
MGAKTKDITIELVNLLKESQKQSFELLKNQIEEIRKENISLREEIRAIRGEKKPKKPVLEEEIIRKFNKNKKDIILQKILQLYKTNNYSINQIKDYIVDERMYCSKATFYRYIDQLKVEGFIKENFNVSEIV